MFITTIVALIIQMIDFYKTKNFLLGNISLILIILSIFVLSEAIYKIKEIKWKR
jgi:uncharacterized membrane protein